ncbi:hypothetical protein NQ318_005268 [Aromia moschata]|uniref:Tetraspanin n=1 Tax=Aromia moschata TaxID=1265417 RepID=A0AAV8Y2Y1_9CUCU|nr:hypothetical protein NQ318_005268 [Aromia moschata]
MATSVAKKVTKRLLKSKKTEEKPTTSATPIGNLNIKFGKPVRQVSYGFIKFLAAITAVSLVCILIFSIKLFSSAVGIRNHLGHFINMVSSGDGEVLPSLQALPVLVFIFLDIGLVYVLYKVFSPKENAKMNWLLFLLLMISLGLIFFIIILLFVVISHIYGAHEELHNGIVEAMKIYSSNSMYKKQMDRLQIEFQCCGSKKYDEWYNITWYDTSLVKKGATDNSQGNTPFSCCSISSIFPCIHHNIENTGKVYLYTPEVNLSISTHGCYSRLLEKKKEVGWGIIGNLLLYITLQGVLVICLRFLQTAHYETSKFEGHSRLYTIWLFGCYAGKKKQEEAPPEPPPVPPS